MRRIRVSTALSLAGSIRSGRFVGNAWSALYYGAMSRPRFPNKLIVIGVSFVLAGLVLLLWTAGFLETVASLWPVAAIVGGLVLLYLRVFRDGRDSYLFFGMSLLFSGLLLLAAITAVPVALGSVWPLFLTIIGLALFLYGMRKRGGSRVTFVTPGAAMVLLSFVFLPFSLGIVSARFSEVVRVWWPVLFVLVGGVLVIAHLGRRRLPVAEDEEEIDSDADEGDE